LKQLNDAELAKLYSHYRLQVQHLQLFCRRGHWLSKSSTHLHSHAGSVDVFPDANVGKAAPAPLSCGPLDPVQPGRRLSQVVSPRIPTIARSAPPSSTCSSITCGDRWPQHHRADRQPIIDIRFDDLVADPTRVVRRIYAQFGYRYSAAFEQESRASWRASGPRRGLRHTYTPEQFGAVAGRRSDRAIRRLSGMARQQRCGELAEAGARRERASTANRASALQVPKAGSPFSGCLSSDSGS